MKQKNKIFQKYFPVLSWLPQYKKEYLTNDVSAGITVGVMLVPQGMAYAMIAGMPPVYGLYAALIPQALYALFGTSRQLAVGPVAMDSLLVATAVSSLATADSEQYILIAISLAFLVGVIQLMMGVINFGFLVNFLSKPVISGFTCAAAIVIGFSQMKYVLGVSLMQKSFFPLVGEVFARLNEVHFLTFVVASFSAVVIKVSRKIHRLIPGALMALIIGVVVTKLFHLNELGLQVIGTIPKGCLLYTSPSPRDA